MKDISLTLSLMNFSDDLIAPLLLVPDLLKKFQTYFLDNDAYEHVLTSQLKVIASTFATQVFD